MQGQAGMRGRWTFRQWLQGHPIGHPTHPMLVHFPTALYPGALLLGVLSRMRHEPAFGQAAAIVLSFGVAASIGAAFLGFIDWWGLKPGSKVRRTATRHMLIQLTAQGFAYTSLAVAVLIHGESSTLEIALLAVASAVQLLGNWFGGVLVYHLGFRVGGSAKPARAAPTVADARSSPGDDPGPSETVPGP